MRPLPRLHAITNAAVLSREEYPVRAAAIAAAGAAVAIHARDRSATAAHLTTVTERLLALARPTEASIFVNGRSDIAGALGAQGIQLARTDLSAEEVRAALLGRWHGWIGASVHSRDEACQARDEGADYVMVGTIFESSSHPGRSAAGLELVETIAALNLPVVAIGGITADRCRAVRDAGAYGIAAISALWDASDSAAAALALLAPWMEDA